ncbi:hypothetical protein L2E82_16668 [Cichorium intybus]|uniref:Uncharacterized protein n=1 Tax=Cichorium intybus TaxID=13427 RepID=A0ACB9F5U2_CICIN|nr:hypothetical protein L2E82_16668 [Cichorium intybus]
MRILFILVVDVVISSDRCSCLIYLLLPLLVAVDVFHRRHCALVVSTTYLLMLLLHRLLYLPLLLHPLLSVASSSSYDYDESPLAPATACLGLEIRLVGSDIVNKFTLRLIKICKLGLQVTL